MDNPTDIQASTTSDNNQYEANMLAAFVQKESKTAFYQKALENMNITGEPNLKWTWSWWGFFGGWAFLLYRKAYLPALAFFTLATIITFVPLAGLILMIILGGIAPYFIIKRYARLKSEIEAHHDTEEARIKAMTAVGGYHTWVVWVAVIFYTLTLATIMGAIIMGAMSATAGQMH